MSQCDLPLSGNFYASGPNCGYSPEAIQDAYKLKHLYKAGYDGTGQTIAIIDWCGSPTIRKDVNSFSRRFGLPPLTPSNFRIIDVPKPSACSGVNPQINRDVEWAHAIAPGAEIALVIAMSSAPQDVDLAEYHAIIAGVGNVLSGSYGFQEHYQSAAEVLNMNLLNEIAAVFGISADFPVGDSPSDDFWWVWAPATSPYATAIGGTTLALNPNHTKKWETGWGSYGIHFDVSDSEAGATVIYSGGSTGQTSEVFPQPSYQKGLPCSNRAAPDIAWVADAFTGALVEFTPAGSSVTELKAYGGTGLACTMFSALWAIANQEAGVPLGQAAPYLYSMPKGSITDVLEVGSKTNPDARIYFSPTDSEDLTSLLTDSMYAAIWNHAGSVDMVFFGDNLFAGPASPGWDFLTGLGTPNAPVFAEYFNPAR